MKNASMEKKYIVMPRFSATVIPRSASDEESWCKDFSLPLEMTGRKAEVNDIGIKIKSKSKIKIKTGKKCRCGGLGRCLRNCG